MKTHKFSIGNTILLNDGRMGKIESLQRSYSDGKEIPSYWVIFGKDVFPDGFARNTWESSIIKKVGVISSFFQRLFLIALFAVFCASCSKESLRPTGTWRLYNDRSNVTEMTVLSNSVSFSRNDSLLSVVEYSGDLLSDPFTMPSGVWHNDNVSGSWSLHGAFLEFSYVGAQRDSSLLPYIPTEIYKIDFFK